MNAHDSRIASPPPNSLVRARRGDAKPRVRVGIYTRQSVLNENASGFTSIDAQRAAVLAYVESRRPDGWVAIDERFDDGGFSGKDMERPALKRLFERVVEHRIDRIAVYRLDRFSRSIADFTRTQSFLEEHGVGFVSISEQFDTSTSTGRLLMNMVSSFAQFERESTADRVRDKIGASRRNGIWTGGRPPLGLDVVDGKLVVNAAEAAMVKKVFQIYLRVGTINGTLAELRALGIKTKTWVNRNGAVVPAKDFDALTLRRLLVNPLLVGKIRAGAEIVDAAHPAIVDVKLFDEVRAKLADRSNSTRNARSARASWSHLLKGLVTCSRCGERMMLSTVRSGPRAYLHLVCRSIIVKGAAACRGSRANADTVLAAVTDAIRRAAPSPELVAAAVRTARDRDGALRTSIEHEIERVAGHAHAPNGDHPDGANGGDAAHVADLDRLADHLRADLAAIAADARPPGVAELRRLFRAFGVAWDALLQPERARLLRLLVERVDVDVPGGVVKVTFRDGLVEAGEDEHGDRDGNDGDGHGSDGRTMS